MKNNKTIVLFLILIPVLVLIFNSCTEDDNTPPTLVTDSITDIDGNVYKTVKIGNTWWMTENLKTQRYRNGDSISYIPQNAQDTAWSNCKTGAYCAFEEKYGFLYNFYSISDPRGIAPQGWHIPDDDEWKELEMFLGMTKEEADSMNWRGNDQGNKLKIEGGNTTYWAKSSDQYTIFGTNESGFTAIGSACRIFTGQWGEITHSGFWWTSSWLSENEACYRGLDYDKSNVFRYYGPKNYGFSVRCVKD